MPQSCQSQAFSSPINGLVWSSNGQEYSTVDGSTFVPLNDWPGVAFYSLVFPAEDEIIVTGTYGGEITMTDDNGATWSYPTNAETGAKSSIYSSVFIDEDMGLLGGSGGLILKTIDGGATWTKIDNPMALLSNKTVFMLYIAPGGDIYAGGSSGILMISTDNGDNWAEVEHDGTSTIYGMGVFSNGQAMLGCMRRDCCRARRCPDRQRISARFRSVAIV